MDQGSGTRTQNNLFVDGRFDRFVHDAKKITSELDETLRQQMEERPWVVLATGFGLGAFLGTRSGLWLFKNALRLGLRAAAGSVIARK